MPSPVRKLEPPGFGAWMIFSLITSAAILWAMYHFWLFREETAIYPGDSRTTYKYRWGYAAEIERDIDEDGRVDQRMIMRPKRRHFGTHPPIQEVFCDQDGDGRFEAHTWISEDKIFRTKIDADFDGKPDQILDDEASVEFLNGFDDLKRAKYQADRQAARRSGKLPNS